MDELAKLQRALDNERGNVAVMNELLVQLIRHHPAGAQVLERSLASATQWREVVVSSSQPDALIAGMDVAIGRWAKELTALRGTPRS